MPSSRIRSTSSFNLGINLCQLSSSACAFLLKRLSFKSRNRGGSGSGLLSGRKLGKTEEISPAGFVRGDAEVVAVAMHRTARRDRCLESAIVVTGTELLVLAVQLSSKPRTISIGE